MRPGLHEPVSVLAIYSQKLGIFKPEIVTWGGVDYRLGKVDFQHTSQKGATTLHYFSLSAKDESAYFKLAFDSNALKWTLEEYQISGEKEVHYA